MTRLTRLSLTGGPFVAVAVSGPEPLDTGLDDQVEAAAKAEARRSGLALGAYLGLLDEPDAGVLAHVYAARYVAQVDMQA